MLDFKDMEHSNQEGDDSRPGVKIPEGTPMEDLGCFFNESQGKLPEEMVKLAEAYGKEKRSITAAEQKIKARKRVQAEKEERLFAMFDACGMSTFGTGEYNYYTRVDSYPSIAVEKAAFKWIEGEGYKDIIKLTVNLRSLASVIKEVFETTGAAPGEKSGIKIRTVNRVGVRKR
ncbi:hypothetical protein KA005_43695 [bacterium]|nr:hypothetical protein [bacterium]